MQGKSIRGERETIINFNEEDATASVWTASETVYRHLMKLGYDYRHMAKTAWTLQNIHVDAAMLAAGHKSVQMHKRYVNLKPADVATAFGLLQSDKKWLRGGNKKEAASGDAS